MAGKQYLLDLTAEGFPVIPTVDRTADLHLLPAADRYVVKPRAGADSMGLRIVTSDALPALADGSVLVQPRVDFAYEVSFVYVDHDFQYALHAPDPDRRWSSSRTPPPSGTWSSPVASSTGTPSRTASSASTHAAPPTASCC